MGALGVVFGDIGTGPLFTLKECLHNSGAGARVDDLFGTLSLIVWSLTAVVTLKYLTFIMKANNGEGGIFALLALVPERMRARIRHRSEAAALQRPKHLTSERIHLAAQLRGNRTVKRAPTSGSLSTATVPPWASAMALTKLSPSPSPRSLRLWSPR